MDEDRISGAATQFAGKIKETVGRVTGDDSLRARGGADQISGQVQNAYGSAKDTAREGVRNANAWIDGTVGRYPLIGLLAAIGFGFVLGRSFYR
jgi:uncharacterized protein YjbJ (UPF0337 family)